MELADESSELLGEAGEEQHGEEEDPGELLVDGEEEEVR